MIVKGYNLKKEDDYLEYLYWELHRKGKITEHEVMVMFKKEFGEYPGLECTFKADWHEWYYENMHKYMDDEGNDL